MRTWIWVTGPERAGKTTLACRLIKSYRSRQFDVMRLRIDGNAKEIKAVPKARKDREEAAYYDAGAELVDVYIAPPDRVREAIDEHMTMNYLFEEENPILFEGAKVGDYLTCDLTIFVMPVLAEGDNPYPLTPLKFPGLKSLLGMEEEEEDGYMDDEERLEEEEEEIIAEVTEDQAKHLALQLAGVVLENRPRPEYESLPRAKVIVINRRKEDREEDVAYTRSRVEKMLADQWGRASIYICDLSDSKDPELKKAIARVKRLI